MTTTNLEIHKVIACVSLSTETTPTTENITPLNSEINLEKCEYLCYVKNLNPGGVGYTTHNATS